MRISANTACRENGPWNIRKWLPGVAAAAVLLGIGSSTAYAQFTCEPISEPTLNRAEGQAELVGDYVLQCTGGTATNAGQPIPQVTITLQLNTSITSRIVGSGNVSEALLLIDEPFPSNNVVPAGDESGEGQTVGQLGCLASNFTNCAITSLGSGIGATGSYNGTPGHYNVFQGVQTNANTITFTGVPLDPSGGNVRIVRITNLRANASQLGTPTEDMPLEIDGVVSVFGSELVDLISPEATLGLTTSGLGSALAPGPASLAQCVTASSTITVSAAEQYATAFLTQNYNQTITPFDDAYSPDDTSPNANQNVPGFTYGTESGLRLDPSLAAGTFIDPGGSVGLATQGTQIQFSMAGVGAGVSLSVPSYVYLSGNYGSASPIGVAVLVGQMLPPVAFSDEETPANGPNVALVISGGTANAVYEVFYSDPTVMETANVPITVSVSPGADPGTVTVKTSFAPLFNGAAGSVPGFIQSETPVTLYTITPCAPMLTSIVPSYGTSGAAVSVTLYGADFLSPATVNVSNPNVTVASVGVVDSGQLTATFIIGSQASPGLMNVSVTTAGGTSAIVAFTINPPLPTLATISPASGAAGESVTVSLTGTNFSSGATVSVSNPGVTVSNVTLVSSNQITATFSIAPGATLGPASVSVTTIGGTTGTVNFNVLSATPQLVVAPLTVTFNATVGGSAPATQSISVTPTSGAEPPVNFKTLVMGAETNSPQPPWISIAPTTGSAPAGIVISANQGSMPAGTYGATIQVLDTNNLSTSVAVALKVSGAPAQLAVAPAMLSFSGRQAAPGLLSQSLTLSNSGTGSFGFTTTVVNGSAWISGVTATSNTVTATTPAVVQVQVNTSGLSPGAYQDTIQISSAAGNAQIPVSLFVASEGSILGVNTTGLLFQVVAGGGSTSTQNIGILNQGDPATTVNWSASVEGGVSWLNLVPAGGTATGSVPGALKVSLAANATQMPPGAYYAQIKISDPNSLNSPQEVTAVLNILSPKTSPTPALEPGGLFFTTTAGGTTPPVQQVQVNTSSASAVTFKVATSTSDNGKWLTVAPLTGGASGQAPGTLLVTANPSGLAAGIYTGNVNVSIGQALESVNVTFLVQPAAGNGSFESPRPEATGCTPGKLVITETGTPNNFPAVASWPVSLIVLLDDDCGAPVSDGVVTASFSNGDPELSLSGDALGNYFTTWSPSASDSNIVVTFNATAASLQSASAQLFGGVAANQTPPPKLSPGGTLNNFNPVVGAPLSPGSIVQVYGAGLGFESVSPGIVPLPTTFDNTAALIGQSAGFAPLYFLSSGQINLQIPYDVIPSGSPQQVPITVQVNNAITQPLVLSIVPAAPGVLSANDGPTAPDVQNGAHIIAQHSADGSLVTAASPGKPGEYLVMYLVGMGAVKPTVASGSVTPLSPLSNVVLTPTVTVGGSASTVLFAGLTPGFVGLYQIDFQVPANASAGELTVSVSQNGVAANPTLLPVGQ